MGDRDSPLIRELLERIAIAVEAIAKKTDPAFKTKTERDQDTRTAKRRE